MKRLLFSIVAASISLSASAAQYSRMTPGSQLLPGDMLVGPDATLVLQNDGNLVLYRNMDGLALWHTNTWGQGVTSFQYQTDGNLVLFKGATIPSNAVWSSGTNNTASPSTTELVTIANTALLRYTSEVPVWRKPACMSGPFTICRTATKTPDTVMACYFSEAEAIAKSQGATMGSCK